MNKLKLIKFRPLGNKNDYKKAKEIILSNKFWCSKLWNLNDPMEGIYSNSNFNQKDISIMFNMKNNYVICSFSDIKVLENPLIWGYYANGFKGIAIEIKIDIKEIKKIQYKSQEELNKNNSNAKEIITSKLNKWSHEMEYRFLKTADIEDLYEIGKITKVYFGNPYSGLNNTQNIIDNSSTLRDFNYFKKELQLICKNKNIIYEDYNINL